MDPDARADLARLLDGAGEQAASEPPPGVFRPQAEIGNLHALVIVFAAQLEVAGRIRDRPQDPELQLRLHEMVGPPLVAPPEPVRPLVVAADLLVELPAQRRLGQDLAAQDVAVWEAA